MASFGLPNKKNPFSSGGQSTKENPTAPASLPQSTKQTPTPSANTGQGGSAIPSPSSGITTPPVPSPVKSPETQTGGTIIFGESKNKGEAQQMARIVAESKGLSNVSVVKEGSKYIVAQIGGTLARSAAFSASAEEVSRYIQTDRLKGPVATSPAPPAIPANIGNIRGTGVEVQEMLQQRYASGQYDRGYSAEIVPVSTGVQSIRFSKTPEGQESTIKRYEAETVTGPSGETRYKYTIAVPEVEQASDIGKWAREHGVEVKRSYEGTDATGRKGGNIILELYSKEILPETLDIQVRGEEQIQAERAEAQGKTLGRQIYLKASPLEKLGYRAVALISGSKGEEFIGATLLKGPQAGHEVAISLIEAKIADIAKGKTHEDVNLIVANVKVPTELYEAVTSPVIDVASMVVGGYGLAKVAATKTGAKVLASRTGRVVLYAAGGLYVAEKVSSVSYSVATGQKEKALGQSVVAVTGLIGGAAAFKAGMGAAKIEVPAPKEEGIKLDISKITGGSVSTTEGKVTVSHGRFKVVEGELKGLVGETAALTQDKRGVLLTKIPEQKIGKLKIEEQQIFRHTEALEAPDKITARLSREGIAKLKEPEVTRLIGKNKEVTVMKELAKVKAAYSPKDVEIRAYTGIGAGQEAREYNVFLFKRGNKAALVERSVIGRESLAKIDWVDISLLKEQGGPVRIYSSKAPSSGSVKTSGRVATKPVAPAVPADVQVKVQPEARVLFNGGRPAGILAKIKAPKVELAMAPATPKIVQQHKIKTQTKSTGKLISLSAAAVVKAPTLLKQEDVVKLKQKPIQLTSTITGRLAAVKEITTIMSDIAPVIEHVPYPPVPARSPAIPIPPTPGLPGLVPLIRLDNINSVLKRFRKGVITNPVPDIEKVI